MDKKRIYVVASYTDTVPGKLITARAKLKFWNRYEGDTFSHISLSLDQSLTNMMSFARKELRNPFNSGLIKENIYTGMFSLNPSKSKIAVMQLQNTEEQYDQLEEILNRYWEHRDDYNFNYLGLIVLLICGTRGASLKDHFFCSQWATTALREVGIDLFPGKKAQDIRPFDFYHALKSKLIYEGLTVDYPYREDTKVYLK